MKNLTLPADAEKPCSCCGRYHRKLYAVDGYWLGTTCAQDYILYRNTKGLGACWVGYERKLKQVQKMVSNY